MIIILTGVSISPKLAMHLCGYDPHPKNSSFVKPDGSGRFHATVLKNPYRIEIHYDLTIEGKHCAGFELPLLHNAERKRILRALRIHNRINPENRKKLMNKVRNNAPYSHI